MEFRRLEKSAYAGTVIHFTYESDRYYKVTRSGDSFLISLCDFEQTRRKDFDDKLFEPWWVNCMAIGLFDGELLAGVAEWCDESFCGRLRVTNLWLERPYRRQGYGTSLMDAAVKYAREHQYREVVLETQNINYPAVSFYKKYGFMLQGLDMTQYRGNPGMEDEVRFEMILAL